MADIASSNDPGNQSPGRQGIREPAHRQPGPEPDRQARKRRPRLPDHHARRRPSSRERSSPISLPGLIAGACPGGGSQEEAPCCLSTVLGDPGRGLRRGSDLAGASEPAAGRRPRPPAGRRPLPPRQTTRSTSHQVDQRRPRQGGTNGLRAARRVAPVRAMHCGEERQANSTSSPGSRAGTTRSVRATRLAAEPAESGSARTACHRRPQCSASLHPPGQASSGHPQTGLASLWSAEEASRDDVKGLAAFACLVPPTSEPAARLGQRRRPRYEPVDSGPVPSSSGARRLRPAAL
jgi:hypothetical protein